VIRRLVVLFLGVLLVMSLVGVATGSALASSASETAVPISATADSQPLQATAASDDTLTQEFILEQRPEAPGTFGTEVRFSVPDRIVDLEIELEPGATAEEATGFEQVEGNTFEWTGSTNEPTIGFRMDANVSDIDRFGDSHSHAQSRDVGAIGDAPQAQTRGGDGYYFVETGSWGIVMVPEIAMGWTHHGQEPVEIDRTVSVDGPGTTGGDIAFFGEYESYTNTAHGEHFELVVPTAASLEESPTEILDALGEASGRLDIGARNEKVFFVAAPTGEVEWGANGVQHGDANTWVRADAPLDRPRNVWLHEYVHTRQTFVGVGDTAPETEWLIEAQAEYEATLLSLELGLLEFDSFRLFLSDGERSPHAETTLADQSTWADAETPYIKGPLVFGTLDKEIRLETDGEYTMRDVLRELNEQDEQLTESLFLEAVEAVGGPAVRESAERDTQTDSVPEAWTAADHQAAFGLDSATMNYAFTDEIERSGPYRNESVTGEPTAVTDETLTFTVDIENVGSETGSYNAVLAVDGQSVDSADGRLEGGERTRGQLAWTPEEAGSYELRVGEETMTVEILEPETATLTDLRVDPARVGPDEIGIVTATVTNEHDEPAAKTVTLEGDGRTIDEETARVGAGETDTVEMNVRFEESGRYQLTANGQETTLTVNPVFDAVPGFGIPAAVLALALCLLGLRLRGPRES